MYCAVPIVGGGPLNAKGGWDEDISYYRYLQVDTVGRLLSNCASVSAASPVVGGGPLAAMGGWDDTNSTYRYLQVDSSGRVVLSTIESPRLMLFPNIQFT